MHGQSLLPRQPKVSKATTITESPQSQQLDTLFVTTATAAVTAGKATVTAVTATAAVAAAVAAAAEHQSADFPPPLSKKFKIASSAAIAVTDNSGKGVQVTLDWLSMLYSQLFL